MKQITPISIATLFAGSFLGAGFLSGQELLQFFGVFSGYGLAGMVLSLTAFGVFGLLVLRIAHRTGLREFDHIIVYPNLPWLRHLVSGIFLFFLFGVMVAMVAGAGALFQQVFGVSPLIGSAIVTVLVLVVALAGVSGMLTAFNLVIPLLMVAAFAISIAAFLTLTPAPIQALPYAPGNPLLGNWLFSAISFVSYNIVGAITILVPLTDGMESETVINKGLSLGTALLGGIFLFILLPVILYAPLVGHTDLPMLELAFQVSTLLGYIYAVLLLCGMFTATLSSLFAITSRVALMGKLACPMWVLTVVLCLLSLVGSLIGFKNVVSIVYPICGYIGILALMGIALHYRILSRKAV